MVLSSSLNSTEANLPETSVVVLNHNGIEHLDLCFDSLLQLNYPQDKLELILVDNASTDGSVDHTKIRFPEVQIIENSRNLGFGRANNMGAKLARSEYVAFLNNDTRVDQNWLHQMVKPFFRSKDVACSGSRILSWDGKTIDFDGGLMNFHGFAFQDSYGLGYYEDDGDERPTIFVCGASMLVDREVFLDVGGFDEDFEYFFEDSEFCLRLWALGYEVIFVPKAITYHRHGATTKRFPGEKLIRLFERNALYTLIKDYEGEDLKKVLPLAYRLARKRAAVMGRGTGDLLTGAGTGPAGAITRALEEISEKMPEMLSKRDEIQRRRRRSDRAIFPLFGSPLRPVYDLGLGYVREHYDLLRTSGVSDLYRDSGRRILVVSSDILPLPGLPTTGAGLRAWGLGKALEGKGHKVYFSMPAQAVAGREEIVPGEIRELAWELETLNQIIHRVSPDLVVVCNWPVAANIGDVNIPVALDQHGPHLLERVYQRYEGFEINASAKILGFEKADFFTCAGDWQRLYFLPWLMQAGFDIEQDNIASIPVSLSPQLPQHSFGPEVTFVYGGVFLPWQDPCLALLTLVEKLEERSKGVLKFFGGKHPFSAEVGSGIFEELRASLERSERVIIKPMIPHDELIREYCTAHVAIDLMKRNPERELAFTTRTVEYLWCGLPVIYNDYSELSSYIREYQAGWVVDPEDKEGIAKVIEGILKSPEIVRQRSENAQRLVREKFTWNRTIAPLDAFCRSPFIRRRRTEAPMQREKSFRELINEAIMHYRRGGMQRLSRETLLFLRRRLTRRS